MKKQSLIKGSIILGIAGIIAKFLGLFFRWPLIMLIGDEGMGFYQMTYPLLMFFVAMASGVPVAISKIVSENNAIGDVEESFKVVKSAGYIMLLMGIATTSILFIFAKPIITLLKWDMKSYYSLIAISFAPLVISTMTIFRGFFQGLQNMTPSAVSQVLEQVGRIVFGVGVAVFLLPMGIEYAAGGAAIGATAGGLLAGCYLYIKYRKVKKEFRIKKIRTNHGITDKILRIAMPISLAMMVGTVMSLIDSILIPQKLIEAGFTGQEATILYAQLTGKAMVIVNIPMTLSVALCASLVPIIAENYVLRREREVNNRVEMALKISSVVSIPCMVGIFILAEPIMKLIFRGKFEGVEILRYISISLPFLIISQTINSILQGVGKYLTPILILAGGCLVKVLLTLNLVPNPKFNIYGSIIATVTAYFIMAIIDLIILRKVLKIKISIHNNFFKPLYAAIVMGGVVFGSYKFLFLILGNSSISCLISIFLGIIIYITLIMLMKVFKVEDIMDRIPKFKR
ncbi:polysaccharide biosynthesis protein [uncultured Clostridium sp.]|uniref:putative polysaccharide biosynthesis protein n=1 Tax=uncultured Clostridium sp. TaxID=59620 RepID=UPI00261F96DA|nr:polysaccharide biosynthesis protein [uncultured Clostridium sp.]